MIHHAKFLILNRGSDCSVADPDPEGSETFGRIRIQSGTEINVSDPDPKLDPKKSIKRSLFFRLKQGGFI
jgi:hypothetical protein